MGKRKESETSSATEVPQAEEPVRLLIIKCTPNSFSAADRYLIKRNFRLVSTYDPKSAVMKALDIKAQLVFLAFDHPNPRVQTLHRIFAQLLPDAICVPFLERMSTPLLQKIRNAGFNYSLSPPITGPKMERMILTIIADKNRGPEAAKDSNRRAIEAANGSASRDFTINIKAAGNDPQSPIILQHLSEAGLDQEWNDTIQAGPQLDPSSGYFLQEGEFNDYISKQDLNTLKQLAPHITNRPNETDGQYRERLIERIRKANSLARQTHENSNFLDDVYAEAVELQLKRLENAPADSQASSDESISYDDLLAALARHQDQCPPHLRDQYKKDPKGLERHLMNQMLNHLNKNQIKVDNLEANQKLQIRSAVEKGTIETIKFLNTRHPTAQEAITFTKSNKALCFMIESPVYFGYLLVAAADDKFPPDLNQNIRDKLKEYIESEDDEVVLTENLKLKLKEVPFHDWAMDEAEFLHKTVINGYEMAFAFFPLSKSPAGGLDPITGKMTGVDIDELLTEIPVEFDLFMHLPLNRKYVKYTRAGLRFYPNQKDRLLVNGIKKMHLANQDVPELQRYRAQNYLNSIIENYKNKWTKKSS